ncbi:dimethylsulfonioproprionate lyase family protein [Aestuariivirga sp.]|uniref:dimethylsulfonioproprionate lyase family protein n=1 Tax=Aestuariivirga sp. TaxID=2650926 RepID=UPI003592E9AF
MSDPVRQLIDACEDYLRAFDMDGAREVVDGIARSKGNIAGPLPPQPMPLCGWLDEALQSITEAEGLKRAIGLARPDLRWITYDAYDDTIGSRFPVAHAFASLIGREGHVLADDFELGLFLITPGTLYRDHHHAAPELYAPVTGPHRWRFGTDGPWIETPAHVLVWNPSWAVHATLVTDVPFLCLFGWTKDVHYPAKVVSASDWAVIEAGL